MENQDFTTTIRVDQSPEEVFNAVNNVRGWWSEEVEGPTEKLNDIFKYHFKDVHRCQMKLIEVIPNKKVVWLVLENYFNFVKDQHEWKGTKVIFEISDIGNTGGENKNENDRTQLRFTHHGLVPQHECYEICHNAWTDYINNSLRDLITKGKGHPNPRETEEEASKK
jgi:hypothetical protein